MFSLFLLSTGPTNCFGCWKWGELDRPVSVSGKFSGANGGLLTGGMDTWICFGREVVLTYEDVETIKIGGEVVVVVVVIWGGEVIEVVVFGILVLKSIVVHLANDIIK